MFGLNMDIGIDLGTANVLVYVRGKGIVLREPSVVAINRDTREVLAIGEEARQMLGRNPGNLEVIRPLKEGVIADYTVTECMLRHFIERVIGRRVVFRPRIMICIPSGVTMVEQRAVQEVAEQAGARHTQLIEEPMAAAIGAGLPVSEATGSMVVDIGGGTTDIAVISLGGIVTKASLRIAGDKLDEAIIAHIRRVTNLLIGERTAEEIKINVAAAYREARDAHLSVRGRDLLTGLPKVIDVNTALASEAIAEQVEAIVNAVKGVLEATPPELSSDIAERGIVLTGGGALLFGLDRRIAYETKLPVFVADEPLSCVALGTGKALEYMDKMGDGNGLSFSFNL